MIQHRIKINRDQHNQRIDMALVACGLDLSRRKIRRILDLGGVYINGKRVRIASRLVQSGDQIELVYHESNLRPDSKIAPQTLDLEAILYEDDHVLAINKPPNLPTQPTKDQSIMHAKSALNALLKEQNRRMNLELVHRLDKETSGILLFAKTKVAMSFLTDQFRQRSVKKNYLALVYGKPANKKFAVSCELSGIDGRTGKVRVVANGGKASETEFALLASSDDLSLIACQPKTGRSHQIRVHLEHLGLPIVGDKRYGKPGKLTSELSALSAAHHFLHAEGIEFKPAAGQASIQLRASLPSSFREALALLKWSQFAGP